MTAAVASMLHPTSEIPLEDLTVEASLIKSRMALSTSSNQSLARTFSAFFFLFFCDPVPAPPIRSCSYVPFFLMSFFCLFVCLCVVNEFSQVNPRVAETTRQPTLRVVMATLIAMIGCHFPVAMHPVPHLHINRVGIINHSSQIPAATMPVVTMKAASNQLIRPIRGAKSVARVVRFVSMCRRSVVTPPMRRRRPLLSDRRHQFNRNRNLNLNRRSETLPTMQ